MIALFPHLISNIISFLFKSRSKTTWLLDYFKILFFLFLIYLLKTNDRFPHLISNIISKAFFEPFLFISRSRELNIGTIRSLFAVDRRTFTLKNLFDSSLSFYFKFLSFKQKNRSWQLRISECSTSVVPS
jgi:hypothetical protein